MNSGSNEKMIIVNSALVYSLRSELRIEIGLPVEKFPQLYWNIMEKAPVLFLNKIPENNDEYCLMA